MLKQTGTFLNNLNKSGYAISSGQPVSEMQVFFYFAALVTVFLRLFWLIIGLAERMPWIPNRLADDFHRFSS